MKIITVILTAVVAFSTPSFAAKGEKRAAKRGEFRGVLRAFDHNRNRQIEGREIDAMKNTYAAFKRADANADGSFGDDEIAALNAKVGVGNAKARKANGGKKKRRKAQ